MAKNESLYNQLLSHLTRVTSGASTASGLGGYAALGSGTKLPAETLIKPAAETETKSTGLGAKVTTTGIKFGSPSQTAQPASNNSTNWGQLASSVASGGLASLVSSGVGSLGLGSIISGLLGLFSGGSKTPPPLKLFRLPVSQDVTVYTGSSGSTVYQGSMDQTATRKTQGPIYSKTSSGTATAGRSATQPKSASVAPTDVNSQWFMERSSDIAAAVRNAMLNSSSLNDVIAEI
jgi:hypothetical protein